MAHTIILDDFGLFLGKKSERFIIRKKGKKIAEFPASDVDRIIIASKGASLSSAAIYLAVENRVPLSFSYSSGHPFAFLTPTIGHGTVITRRSQYTHAESVRGCILANGFVKGKLLNQRCLLNSWAKNRTRTDPKVSDNLFDFVSTLDDITNELENVNRQLDSHVRQHLMNIEGRGAISYWAGVSLIVPSDLQFKGRETRGAEDPLNMMLNYGYGILYSEVWSAVTTAGLDPFAGFLHVDRPGRPSLVLDLIEEFRQQVVDRIVIKLVTKKIVTAEKIVGDEGLSKNVKEKLAADIISRLAENVSFQDKKIALKNVIVRQAWAVAKYLRSESQTYVPFTLRW
jgi:CRISPR-associated protein Cas1